MRSPFSFMNTPGEWHAFVVGFFEGLTLFIPAQFRPRAGCVLVIKEYWYYSFGRGTGLIAAVLVAVGFVKMVKTLT